MASVLDKQTIGKVYRMNIYPEQRKYLNELFNGTRTVDNDKSLDCAQSYSVYKFHPEIGAFAACCDATLINYDHEQFISLKEDYFDKHPALIQRKKDLRNNIKNSQCNLCWKKEEQGLSSMRQVLATENKLNHQNPYLDIEKSYPTRIELWMQSTCNLGCFMCHLGNSNTLRKIWWKDYDEYGNDGYGHKLWTSNSDLNKYNMKEDFNKKLDKWLVNSISNRRNPSITIAYLGGEPTLHTEMFDHADRFIEAGASAIKAGCNRKITITTNGTSKDKLNERFYNMYKKYKAAGWKTHIMLSQDGVDEAAQVRHGANSAQIMRNFDNWISPDSVIQDVSHFTVLSNLNFPYAHNLAYKIRDTIDNHYKNTIINDKDIDLSFNAIIGPEWMQIKYLPKKFAEQSAKECIEIFDYLNKTYNISVKSSVFKSVLARMDENPSQEDVNFYFERLHYVQRIYKKTYPNWNFYDNFPHLIEFANDYRIERQ